MLSDTVSVSVWGYLWYINVIYKICFICLGYVFPFHFFFCFIFNKVIYVIKTAPMLIYFSRDIFSSWIRCCLSLSFVCSQIWSQAAVLTNKSIWINLPSRVNEALYEFEIYYMWATFPEVIPSLGKFWFFVPHCSRVYLTFESHTKWCVATNWFIFLKSLGMPHNQTNQSTENSFISFFVGKGWSLRYPLAYSRSPITNVVLSESLRNKFLPLNCKFLFLKQFIVGLTSWHIGS